MMATFARINDMEQAAEALKKQGVIDLRVEGNTGSTLPDQIDFSQPQFSKTAAEPAYALWVSVEKSRCRQAEDTIRKYGGVF
jgi:hypothetical protein